MSTTLHTFEILIVDQSGKSEITTVKSLIMAISYSEKLWQNVEIKNGRNDIFIEDKALNISLQASKLPSASAEGVAFVVSATSSQREQLESFRERLFVHALHRLGFTTARILTDTISESLSLAIYPLIKSAENALRTYLEKGLTQKAGWNWWESAASASISRKVQEKSTLDKPFAGLVDHRMTLTDFDDLAELAAKTSIADSSFKNKWEALAALRARVSSYGVFTSQDYASAETLSKELVQLLGGDATKNIQPLQESSKPAAHPASASVNGNKQEAPQAEEPKAPVAEAAPVRAVEPTPAPTPVAQSRPEPEKSPEPAAPVAKEEVKPKSNEGNFDLITENVLLEELKTVQSLEKGAYVDLKSFVTKTLANKGYAFGPAYMVAKNMDEKGLVKIYETKDEKGFLVKAIRAN